MTAPAETLARSDFLRAPLLAAARPADFKEWHHFVVARPEWRLLVNLSLTAEPTPEGPVRIVPRVIVIAHDQRWTGAVARFEPAELDVSADLRTVTVAGNRVVAGPDGYRIVLDLPEHDIEAELHLVPASRPFVVNNQPVGDGRLSWLFVPRLRAHGRVRLGGTERRLDGEVAYHDHNWGRFRWGGDFAWDWASVLPTGPDDPWSFVYMRMTDGRRHRTLSQALYVWRGDERAAMFRDAAIRTSTSGLLGRAPDCTLPPPMRLVLGGAATDVPETVAISASRAGDSVHAVFRPESYARLAQPSEVRPDRSVVLCEIGGTARITGSIGGERFDVDGAGVFEALRG